MRYSNHSLNPSARLTSIMFFLYSLTLVPAPALGQQVPIPELARWESQMTTYGLVHCYLGPLDHVYYDAERVYSQIATYTGDSTWSICAEFAESTYRDQYVLPNDGSVPGYWNFTTGLRLDYDLTGDPRSQEAAVLLSQNMFARDGVPLDWTASADSSREVAYAIVSYINAEAMGEPKRQRRIDLVNQAYDHMDQWFLRFAWPGPWQKSPQETARLAPFMVGLTAHTLIRDWEETQDPRLIPSLRRAADWMWANAWVALDESMWYESLDRSAGAPDLNLLIAPIYGFLHQQTGETKYRDQGDALFAGGVRRAFLGGGKQFNQNYWWSFDYVQWRTSSAADTSAPSVTLTAPVPGTTVRDIVTLTADATDDVGVAGVQFKVDVADLGPEDITNTYSVTWDTTRVPNGSYTLTAVARDAAGNTSTAPPVTVNVANPDVTAPIISITSPANGAAVSQAVTLAASASDNEGVAGVQFTIDNVSLGLEQTVPPFWLSVDTRLLPNGSHSFTAVARDTSNNTATATVTVSVVNDTTPPVLSAVSAANVSTSTATIDWTTNEPSDSQVEYGLTAAYGSTTPLDGRLVTAHSQALSGLAAGTVYHYRVTSKDAWGNVTTSADFTFTTPSKKGKRIGHWALNEGAGISTADASGNSLTGALAGATWATGKAGAALSFDGVNDSVDVPGAPALNGYPLTVAAWIKTGSASGVRGIVNKYVAGSFNGWNLFLNDGNLCAWYLRDSASYVYEGGGCTFSVPGYNDNQWHHVVYTVGADGGRLYVDGILKGSAGWTGTPGAVSTTEPLRLGRYPGAFGGAEYFPGLLDDVRIYDSALTGGDVMALYRGIGAAGVWPLDEGAGTTTLDTSDSNVPGSLVNGPAWTAGRLGSALAFDGVDDYVEIPHAAALGAYPLTVATWIKTTSASGVRGIVNKYAAGSFNGWNLFLNDGKLCAWHLRDSANYVYGGGGCTLDLAGYNDGQWHHIAYVVDAAGGRLYVDGALRGSLGWTGNPGATSTTQPVRLGHYPGAFGGAEYFPGLLDDVRIYDRALSDADITGLASGQ